MEEGDGVCSDEFKENTSQGKQNYKLLKNKKEYCAQVDFRYRRISQIGEKTFFDINDFSKT